MSKGGILIPVGISGLVISVLIGLSTIPIAKAQIFPLSQQQLPPGTYVVTPEGYWSIQQWVAAHPGKPIPASIIVIPSSEQSTPQITVKTKTKQSMNKSIIMAVEATDIMVVAAHNGETGDIVVAAATVLKSRKQG